MTTNIAELVTNHSGNNGVTATDSCVDESAIQLDPLEKHILIASASPFHGESHSIHNGSTKDDGRIRSIKDKLGVSGQYFMFGAVSIALDKGSVTIDDVLDGRSITQEFPKFKVTLRKLSRAQKRILAEFYNSALQHQEFTYGEVATTLQYSSSIALGNSLNRGGQSPIHSTLGIHDRGQLAFLTHIYMHFMRNPVEELFTEKQLDALEARVIKTRSGGIYKVSQEGISDWSKSSLMANIKNTFNVDSSAEAVLKALDSGFYTLLLEMDFPAFASLEPNYFEFLRNPINRVASPENRTKKNIIYKRLGISNMSQLAPYMFLATNLDESGMRLLRTSHTSPDNNPINTLHEIFRMPNYSTLLAPQAYLNTKCEMAAKST